MFLCPDRAIAQKRDLESMSTDVQMLPTAMNITVEGQRRREQLCLLFADGKEPTYRPSVPPHFLTVAEKTFYEDDSRRTVLSLKTEFLSMLQKLPKPSVVAELCDAMESAKSHAEVLSVVCSLRQVYASVSVDISSDL